MVTIEKIREDMKKELEKDSDLHSVEVRADTLEEALADAGVQLDSNVKNLEYEVQEKGSAGMFGLAKKPWKIKVYMTAEAIEKQHKQQVAAGTATSADGTVAEEEKIIDKDGVFFVHYFGSDIYLKVLLPVGNGQPVALEEVMAAARRADTLSIEENDIKKFVASGTDGEYKSIGMFNHVQSADAVAVVDISSDDMLATVTVTPPAVSGAEISIEQFKKLLIDYNVSEPCISIEKITEFVDNPIYNVPFEMATARKAIDGADAYMDYKFETDNKKHRMKEDEKTGQINFKELNLIHNVVAGELLAVKIDAQRGQGGKTISGRYLEARNGKDIQIPLGKNVKLDADGHSVLAAVDGQVSLDNGKICVEPVITYEKGINAKTGNVSFVGNVIVNGNVEDGYDIKADGNIEINGGVGNCKITAGGFIFITQGVMGRDEGVLTAGKSIWAKFINSAKVDAGEHVLVTDSIMTSEVTAMKRIILRGKRAQITGGHLFATEEIAAKNLGNESGTETILEVGIDPKAKQRQAVLQAQQNALIKELEDVDLNINTLEMNKKNMRKLPIEKEEKLNELVERKNQIIEESDKINAELESINEHLRELKAIGKVKIEGTAHPGSIVYVRDVKDDVRTEVKAVTFYYEGGFVKRGKYEKPTVDDIEAPEGYSGM